MTHPPAFTCLEISDEKHDSKQGVQQYCETWGLATISGHNEVCM